MNWTHFLNLSDTQIHPFRLFSPKSFDLSLDLILLKENLLKVLKVKVHFYLVSPTKYELLLDKGQLNVAFCACDISCNRKMGLSLKIYMICPFGLRPSSHHIHQINHLSLFEMLIIP